MIGQLYHLPFSTARVRADEVLEQMGLSKAANQTVGTYSGGMRRRLDLGASLVGRPRILFLDEPTTGLDPRTRLDMWETTVSYTHLRAHETDSYLVCRLL